MIGAGLSVAAVAVRRIAAVVVVPGLWLLLGGIWNDNGVWDDAAAWVD